MLFQTLHTHTDTQTDRHTERERERSIPEAALITLPDVKVISLFREIKATTISIAAVIYINVCCYPSEWSKSI